MAHVYGSWAPDRKHAWNRFALLDVQARGHGGCGNAHVAVNAARAGGYDRENRRVVLSHCYSFLARSGPRRRLSCSDWSCTTLGYLRWWHARLPHRDGRLPDGKLANWWRYVLEPVLAG